jgi:hypothetical protein
MIYRLKISTKKIILSAETYGKGRDKDSSDYYGSCEVSKLTEVTELYEVCYKGCQLALDVQRAETMRMLHQIPAYQLGHEQFTFKQNTEVWATSGIETLTFSFEEDVEERGETIDIFFNVHQGIRGWYIESVAKPEGYSKVTCNRHEKFEKYGWNAVTLENQIHRYGDLKDFAVEAERIIRNEIKEGINPDERYSFCEWD